MLGRALGVGVQSLKEMPYSQAFRWPGSVKELVSTVRH